MAVTWMGDGVIVAAAGTGGGATASEQDKKICFKITRDSDNNISEIHCDYDRE